MRADVTRENKGQTGQPPASASQRDFGKTAGGPACPGAQEEERGAPELGAPLYHLPALTPCLLLERVACKLWPLS